MEPLTLLTWVGVTAAAITILSITALIAWSVVQTMRGKPTTRPSKTVIHHGGS